MLREPLIAAVRTGIAAAVGFLITFLLSKGWELPDDLASNLNVVLLSLVIAGYNYLVIILERHVHPGFGFLLGIPKTPSYSTSNH